MNAFSRRTIVDYDPDMEATATALNEQARALIAGGHMPEAAYRSCVTLKDLQVLVENVTATQRSAETALLQSRAAELTAALEENPPMDRTLAIIDELAEIGNKLQRDGDAVDQWGDARREQKFGTQL